MLNTFTQQAVILSAPAQRGRTAVPAVLEKSVLGIRTYKELILNQAIFIVYT
jgi:hypothetical protein